MMRGFLAILSLAAIAGCAGNLTRYPVSTGEEQTGFYENPATPELAVLEYRIAKYLDWDDRPTGTVCSGMRNSTGGGYIPLPGEIEARLAARFPSLAPFAACLTGDGQPSPDAAIFHSEAEACGSDDGCVVNAGYRIGAGGYRSRYRARWDGGVWRLQYDPERIVLTGAGE